MTTVDSQLMAVGQRKMLDAVPDHTGAAMPVGHATIPASEYVDPARFELEKRTLFSRQPMLAGLSAQLPKSGSYFQIIMLDVPLLVTRARDGKVRAFVNVCKHRGTILCSQKSATGSRITCPYHAWTYSLEGELVGIPRAEIFGELDKSKYNLTELRCEEAGGLIWVGVKHGRETDFSGVIGELVDDMDAFKLSGTTIFTSKTYKVGANWKLIADAMLDSYHVTRLHHKTLGRYFVDAPTLFENVGPHLRSLSGRGNFDRKTLRYDLESIRRVVGFSYILFPNGVIVLSPDYINVAILRPITFDTTEVDYYIVTNPLDGRNDRPEMEDKLRRSFELMDVVFGEEDFWAASLGQQGLSAGVVDDLLLGGMEMQMKKFHDIVNCHLGEA
jgi:nitrite reductase/ring-hydroxylating ferredoxin subunit